MKWRVAVIVVVEIVVFMKILPSYINTMTIYRRDSIMCNVAPRTVFMFTSQANTQTKIIHEKVIYLMFKFQVT